MSKYHLLFSLLYCFFPFTCICSSVTPRIAVIGGGIGGSTVVHYLRDLFQDDCSITLFEKSHIGGRMATVKVAGRNFEAGGSVLHPKNLYLDNFIKLLGLHVKMPFSGHLGIYDGKEFIFKESSWEVVTIASLLWRYGWSAVKMKLWITDMLDKFSRIYELQENGVAFTTVDQLLKALHPTFPEMMKLTLESYMIKKGFSHLFIDELAQAVMLVNYGQTKNISAFAGAVSLAGAQPGLWNVYGGNKLVAEGLVKKAGVSPQHAEVVEIALDSEKTFSVTFRTTDAVEKVITETFDIVIVATPLVHGVSDIKFVNFSSGLPKFDGNYHHLVVTFINGKLKPSFFGLKSNLTDEILTNNPSLVFNSLGKVTPVNYAKGQYMPEVWKIFSERYLTSKEKLAMFEEIDEESVVDWFAYPQYPGPKQIPPFVLFPGLFYVNSIEFAASAIEMSAISGRNVALLAYNYWTGNSNKVNEFESRKQKIEL